ncbi:hypothetical protein APSETT444_006081 [Aspergillus pseudonomiae]
MIALNDEYEGLEEFFVDITGVQTLTLEMVITKLVDQGSTSASIEEVKETIWLLNKYLQTDDEIPDSQSIWDAKVFPVRDVNGQTLPRSCDEAFSIADRKHLYDWFAGKARFLDFSVNDIHRLGPFLNWVGLERQPTTTICAPFPDRALDVMEKVLQVPLPYVAATLDRAGVVSIETEDVAEEDGIDLTTSNGDRQAEEVSGDAASGYRNQFGTESNTPSATFPTPSVVSGEIGEESVPLSRTRSNFRSLSPSSLLRTPRSTYDAAPVDIEYRSILEKVVSAARQFIFPTRGSIDTSLLGEFQNLHLRKPSDNTGHLRSLEKLERDKRIGAAGELFVSISMKASDIPWKQEDRLIHPQVFEVLSRLRPNLPGFSRESWQSTIRQYIQLHEDYIDLQPWCGRETADLVYTDSEGILTSFLIAKGYLSSKMWAGKSPRFYLEVKSTTSSCETPFYMSKYQYEREGFAGGHPPNY